MGEKISNYRYFIVGTLAVFLIISMVQAAVVTYKVAEVVPGRVGPVGTLKNVVTIPTPPLTLAPTLPITIDSDPSGATLYLDGVARGSTPATVTIGPGSHSIILKKTGYLDYEQTVDFGQAPSWKFTLIPAKIVAKLDQSSSSQSLTRVGSNIASGVPTFEPQAPADADDQSKTSSSTSSSSSRDVTINSVPSGADLYIDNQHKGTTGINGITVTIKTGSHLIRLTKTGYLDYEQTVDFGQAPSWKFTLTAFSVIEGVPTFAPTAPGTPGVQSTTPTIIPTYDPRISLTINSDPSGAELFVDNQDYGSTPITFQYYYNSPPFSPGLHSIRLKKDGYYDYSQSVDFSQMTSRTFYLTPLQTTTITTESTTGVPTPHRTILIDSVPSGAQLFVDSQVWGPTPTTVTIEPGSHSVKLTKTGYLDYYEPSVDFSQVTSRTFYLTPLQTTTITTTITPTQTYASHRNILIDSVPPGAELTVDSQDWGPTPTTVTILTGLHTIRLTKSGFYDYVASVDFGGDTYRTFSLSPVQGTTSVITVTPTITISPTPSRPPGFSASTFIIALIIVTLTVGIRRYREGL